MENILSNLPADTTLLASEYIGILRYALPALTILLLLRCFFPLLTFRREPEIWAWLNLSDGSQIPVTHWETVIGRSKSCDVTFGLGTVSRNHAVLTRYDDGSWTISDAGSRGGTFVNNRQVEICALKPTDRINIGGVEMQLHNNYDWSKDINFIDFLRDYGKFFNVNYMLDKDIIRRRLDTGITYTEFSYMIMQALDFLHLYETKNCVLQVAGSDQWGNITAGVDLIRKKAGKEAYAFTMPLVTDSTGKKFGKSEGNALWLDKSKTSSYELYQFLINAEDEKVIDYLKIYTFLTKEEIEEIEIKHQASPELRLAQKELARGIITFLHGEEEYEKALQLSQVLFSGDVSNLTGLEIEQVFHGVTKFDIEKDENILDFLVNHGIVASKREAREFITSGSIMLNGNKITDLEFIVSKSQSIEDKYIIIRRGKKKYYLGIYHS